MGCPLSRLNGTSTAAGNLGIHEVTIPNLVITFSGKNAMKIANDLAKGVNNNENSLNITWNGQDIGDILKVDLPLVHNKTNEVESKQQKKPKSNSKLDKVDGTSKMAGKVTDAKKKNSDVKKSVKNSEKKKVELVDVSENETKSVQKVEKKPAKTTEKKATVSAEKQSKKSVDGNKKKGGVEKKKDKKKDWKKETKALKKIAKWGFKMAKKNMKEDGEGGDDDGEEDEDAEDDEDEEEDEDEDGDGDDNEEEDVDVDTEESEEEEEEEEEEDDDDKEEE